MNNISSVKKTILVFSDPHMEIDKLNNILKYESYDIVVSLGDFFDSFYYNTPKDIDKTCNFIKKWGIKDNFYNIFSNHDVQYLYNNKYTICSGYEKWKDKQITENFGNFMTAIRDKFKWHIWIDDFLCTHAGLHPSHLPPHQNLDKESLSKWLDDQTRMAELTLINGGHHWVFSAGRARGGRYPVGGLNWLDYNEEFEPIDGLKQLVGHTHHRNITPHFSDGNLDLTQSSNLDIDCGLNQYLLINNRKLTIKNYADL